MLYLFANERQPDVPAHVHPGLQYFGPGVYHQNLDAISGGSIYLAPGAVVFGALNFTKVDHVKVFGRGVIVYDGPQNPDVDEGWMQKRNWHCIGMNDSHDITVEGITCVTRSRTWQVQMKGTQNVRFENVKVIGAVAGNANVDGVGWLDGSGHTVITNSFFRAADDVFAMQDSWEGNGAAAAAVDGKAVGNIRVDHSELSSSFSNIVRAGWPEKSFRGGHFSLEDSDILHEGIGGCGVPSAVMEVWADPHARGQNGDYNFRDVRMDNWSSLVNIRQQPVDGVYDVNFTDIFGLEAGSQVDSVLKGHVHGVKFDNVVLDNVLATKDSDIPVLLSDGADKPTFAATGPVVHIADAGGIVRPHKYVLLEAQLESGEPKDMQYLWDFGDGTTATGPSIHHEFPDTDGTLLDGSARFRVLLHVIDAKGRSGWAYDPVVVGDNLTPALEGDAPTPAGAQVRYFEMANPELDGLAPTADQPAKVTPKAIGVAKRLSVASLKHRAENYAFVFDAYLEIPDDSGYTFTLLANDAAEVKIDDDVVAVAPKPQAQGCGLAGNAVRSVMGSVILARGKHRLHVEETHTTGEDNFRVLWQRAGQPVSEVPAAALSHERYMP